MGAASARELAAQGWQVAVMSASGSGEALGRELGLTEETGGEDWDVDAPFDDGNPMGTPESDLHWAVDVSAYVDRKRAALACHASQPDAAGMLTMYSSGHDHGTRFQDHGRNMLIAAGLTLLLITLVFNILGQWLRAKFRENY